MDLRQLRYFVAVAEERRFARAAERLHITAPTLSQQIQALERELHIPLFDRNPHRVELTPAGQVLLIRARIILAEADRAQQEVRAAGAGLVEQLSLRVCTLADQVLDGPLHDTALGIPGLEVRVALSPGDDALEAVRQARADAAVVWTRAADQRDLAGRVLGEVPFGVALPPGHALSVLPAVPVDRLRDETLVMFPREPFAGIWDPVVAHLLPAGAGRGQVVIEPDLLDAPEALLRAVSDGRGVAPVVLGTDRSAAGVAVRPVLPPLRVDLEVVYREPPRPAVCSLVDALAAAAHNPATALEPRLPHARRPDVGYGPGDPLRA
ncbi:MAG: DNA-binding transcriptional regulator, LysR family [Mycobacterium sp.]|nr:DNA-binding transcriptional regulator, LysR family [Mycobacterium sp.]